MGTELAVELKTAEHISLAELFRVIPMATVKEVLCTEDANDERERKLPARYIVYFVIALSLFSYCSAIKVFCNLVQGLRLLYGPMFELDQPAKSSLTYKRKQIGVRPFEVLFQKTVKPIGKLGLTRGAFFKHWRLVGIDAIHFNVPDSIENDAAFGRAKTGSGDTAFPAVRCVTLIELGTRVLFDYVLGPSGGPQQKSENALATELLPKLKDGYLCIGDRLYANYKLWMIALETGAGLLWRVKSDISLECQDVLADGSYTAKLYLGDRRRSTDYTIVRVIEYLIKDELYRLITNLSVEDATNDELARLYHERWEHENANKEQKDGLNAYIHTLRSKTPELVKQELLGLFLMYFAVRNTMHDAAISIGEDVDHLSFSWTLDVIRRQAPLVGAFPP